MFLTCLLIIFWLNLIQTQPASAKIIINEVLPQPDPDSGIKSDSVELTVVDQTEPAQLLGWTIWDEHNLEPIYAFQHQLELAVGDYYVVSVSNKLNNSGDSVVLKDLSGAEQDRFSYQDSQLGISFARLNSTSDKFAPALPSLGSANTGWLQPTASPTPTSHPTPTPAARPSPQPTPNPSPAPTAFSQIPTAASPTPASPPEPTLNPTQQHQLQAIQAELDSLHHRPRRLALPTASPATTVPGFGITHRSPTAILSVIIGGLCLLGASLLLYVNR